MTEATTKTCEACGGRGKVLMGYLDETCAVCNGTGIETTGEFLGMLSPESAAGFGVAELEDANWREIDGEWQTDEQSVAIAALEAGRDEYQGAARRLAGVVTVNNSKLDESNATIAALRIERDDCLGRILAQDAEIERLKREIAIDESGYKGEIATLKVEREKARADVRRLKGDEIGLLADNGRLVTERDELRLRVETLTNEVALLRQSQADRDELFTHVSLNEGRMRALQSKYDHVYKCGYAYRQALKALRRTTKAEAQYRAAKKHVKTLEAE